MNVAEFREFDEELEEYRRHCADSEDGDPFRRGILRN